MTRANKPLLALFWLLAAAPVAADGLRLRTDIATTGGWSHPASLDTALGFQNRFTTTANARLIWDKTLGDFKVEVQSHLAFAQGDAVAYGTALSPFLPAAAPATLFDLTRIWASNTNTVATNTIDRLNVSYASQNLVIRIGRQAITWGGGTVFHPTDILAPFAPNALDTSYKPGADMVYGQYLFASGADFQAVWVPRSATPGGPVTFANSTTGLRARTMLGPVDTALMLARDRGDSLAALTLGAPLGGASISLEYAQWALASGGSARSYLANVANFGILMGRNISYYAEYYHNGFGVDASVPFDSLPASLTKRMSTGQVFNAGRDFLALGLQMQITPDLTLAPNALVNLNDHSALAAVAVNLTLDDNTNLVVNYLHPFGAVGTEFGGRETSAGSGIYIGPSRSLTVQLVRYF